MSVMISIFLGLIGLALLVLIHEYGHFVCARLVGIHVEVFSVGFGPKLWKKNVKGVEYAISAIPLGGYCKMAGETLVDGQEPKPGDMYYGHPWRRAIAVLGGPLFSFLSAWVFFVLAAPLPRMVDNTPSRIVVQLDLVKQAHGQTFGFVDGDTITAVDGEKVTRFDEVYRKIVAGAKKKITFDILRQGHNIQLRAMPILLPDGQGFLPLMPWYAPVIDDIIPGQPAHRAGLLVGDLILTINGEKVENTAQLSAKIAQSKGPVILTVQRGTEIKEIGVDPDFDEERQRRTIGVFLGQRQLSMVPGSSILQMFDNGSKTFFSSMALYLHGLGNLFRGVNPLRALSGPVQNTYIIGEVAKTTVSVDAQGNQTWSLYNILTLLAFISLALGIMNLLPIPLLDGGLLVLYAIEALRGKYLTPRGMQLYQYVGLSFIAVLFILALGSDVFFILRK